MKFSLLPFLLLLLLAACTTYYQPVPAEPPVVDPIASLLKDAPPLPAKQLTRLKKLGYATQVGAFSRQDNAVRLEQALKDKGVDAYFFLHEEGLYKVRFGNHPNYAAARAEAERLRAQGVIGEFFTVAPAEYAVTRLEQTDAGGLRNELVLTAKRFLGVPYRWGGEDTENGFDCSGLTMVSYRLNGLDLPRNSRMQFQEGTDISKEELQKGDLVFFATKGGTRVTHVGMYVGAGEFIHAPRPGKTVRIASLSHNFWLKTYVGARSYL